MFLFYAPEITSDLVVLSGEESRHCTGVLRKIQGDVIRLTDGKGFFYDAVIESIRKGTVEVRIQKKENEKVFRNYYLHIGIAPTKNISRLEWFLEKSVEIGIDEITPVITEHSERKEVRTGRFEKIMISAMKQSIKATLPGMNNPVRLAEFVRQRTEGEKYICYCDSENTKLLKDLCKPCEKVTILIGPEGDFTPGEIIMARKAGYEPSGLGESRLRTETAALVACHTVYLLNQ